MYRVAQDALFLSSERVHARPGTVEGGAPVEARFHLAGLQKNLEREVGAFMQHAHPRNLCLAVVFIA
jgi:hypothetical protein